MSGWFKRGDSWFYVPAQGDDDSEPDWSGWVVMGYIEEEAL